MAFSFVQFIIVIILLFLMFGDFKTLGNNFKKIQNFFLKKTISKQEKRDLNP